MTPLQYGVLPRQGWWDPRASKSQLLDAFTESSNSIGSYPSPTRNSGTTCRPQPVCHNPHVHQVLSRLMRHSAKMVLWQYVICVLGAGVTLAQGPAVTLSTTSVSFATQVVGTVTSPKIVVVTNSGTSSLNVTGVSVSANFGQTTNCTGVSLAPRGKCSIMVTFAPTVLGALTGVLSIFDDAGTGTQ